MLLSNDTIIMIFDLYQNIRNAARMTLYYASEIFFKKNQLTLKQTYIFPETLDNLEQNNSA